MTEAAGMTERRIDRAGVRLHARLDGPEGGPALVLLHALGLDLTLWDGLLPHLDPRLRLLRLDMRGHGLSDVPPAPYTMGALIADAEAACEACSIRDAVLLGLSIGGLIAQGLAVKRLDLVRGLILSNTAARIGTPSLWQNRIEAVRNGGMAALAEATMERWFTRPFRAAGQHLPWRDRLLACPVEGYAGCAAAIAGTDFYTTTAALRLPSLGIAGSEDGATPPDLMRETLALIPGSRFEILRRAGHLPFLERPAEYAALVNGFLHDIGHLPPEPHPWPTSS